MATRAKTRKTRQARTKAKSQAKRAVKKVARAAKKVAKKAAKKAAPKKAAPKGAAKKQKRTARATPKVVAATMPASPELSDLERSDSVDVYLTTRVKAPWKSVMAELRMVVKTACPEAVECLKWGQPVYELNGPFIWMRPATDHVSFGFWRGADLTDPEGLLEGTGARMRHLKIGNPEEVPVSKIDALIRQAADLNREESGSPSAEAPLDA
jgi:hypothetical protein